jgi:hypothetical protein
MAASTKGRGTVLLATVGALIIAALAMAPQSQASTVYACVKKTSGTPRIVSKKTKCKKSEKRLSWSTQGPAGKNGATGAPGTAGAKGDTGAAATTLWAVVESTGTLARGGTGTVSAKSPSTGRYEIVFKQNVSKCAYIATEGSTTAGVPVAAFVGVATLEENPDGVFVETFNTAGVLTAEPFHLAVFC